MDRMTLQRAKRFASEFRGKKAVYPTLKDFKQAGFGEDIVDKAVRSGLLEQYYMNLTNGSVVKGYKPKG